MSEPELKPERVWLPDSVIQLAAVSPELENVEGAYWVRENTRAGSPQPTTAGADTESAAMRAAKRIRSRKWSSNITADEAMVTAIITHEMAKEPKQ